MKAGPYPSHGGFRLSGPIHITGTARRRSGGGRDNRAVFEIQEQSDGHLFGLSGSRQPQTGPWPGTAPAPLPLPQSGAVLFVGSATIEDSGLFESVRLGYLLFVSWGICFRRWRGGLDRGGGATKF
jgi:hypothetical protein